ncbi:MAG TPA: hypothetical protein VMA37_00660 [Acetobacteraceae bacterium]|nr:hypothetical protein [Acetobacteraceae bacterium]
MTELLPLDRLNAIVRKTAEPGLPLHRPVVTLTWTIDATTGRPIGRWVVGDGPGAAAP